MAWRTKVQPPKAEKPQSYVNKSPGAVPRRGFMRAIDAARALGTLISASLRMEVPGWRSRVSTSKKRHRTTYWMPNGQQECERRRRQIAQGRLKEENGLVRGKW